MLAVGTPFRDTAKLDLEFDDKCRVLAMRGGGSKGAYEVGSLRAMAHMLDPIDIAYDVVEGVSIGSINAAFYATYERGDEKAAIDKMEKLWLSLPVKDFWDWWPILGPLEALWRPSVLDNTKMRDKMHELLDGVAYHRSLTVSAVDLNTGRVVVFDETTPPEDLTKAVISSASIPVAFKPQEIGSYTLVDGGVFTDMKFSDAIGQCNEKGFSDEKIIVDLLMCSDTYERIQEWELRDATYKNAFDLYSRKDQFKDFYGYFEDISREIRGYPEVHFRHLFLPQKPLAQDGFIPIFDGVEPVKSMLAQGEEETRRNLKMYLCEVENKCDEEDLVDEPVHHDPGEEVPNDDSAQSDLFGEDGMPRVRASRGRKSGYESVFGFHTVREFMRMQDEGQL